MTYILLCMLAGKWSRKARASISETNTLALFRNENLPKTLLSRSTLDDRLQAPWRYCKRHGLMPGDLRAFDVTGIAFHGNCASPCV